MSSTRRFALLIAAGIAVLAAGCASAPIQLKPVSIPIIPPQQLLAQVCPIVMADLALLQSPSGRQILSADQQAKVVSTIAPASQLVCTQGATIDLTNLQTFNHTVFPALTAIVAATPAIPNQPAILLALQLGQPILNQIVADAIAAHPPTPASSAPSGS